jgi:hypothetical protein
MSVPRPRGPSRALWQYHSRSDLHSKAACWGVLFDLLQQSRVLRNHAKTGKVVFGVNFEMRDHRTNRKKDLDLVIARPAANVTASTPTTLDQLAVDWSVVLDSAQHARLSALPSLYEGPVGAVLIALEAKAAMTAFSKARPRLHDELVASREAIHGHSRGALAVGLSMVNASPTFVSPILNRDPPGTPGQTIEVSQHGQPRDAASVVDKLREIPRRSGMHGDGFDGLGVVLVDCKNDSLTPVKLVTGPPAPQVGDVLHYDTMVTRVANEYDRNFHNI